MSIFRRLLSCCALGAASLLAVLGTANEAHAQGSRSDNGIPHQGSSCPNEGWTRGGSNKYPSRDRCYPTSASSPKIYRVDSLTKCAPGYGKQWSFCIEGFDPNWMANQSGNIAKPSLEDRCPAGWVSTNKPVCRPEVPKPATARLKGGGACKANEVEEWGIWCTSNFEHLTAKRVKQAAAADWNDIYTATRGKKPRQSPDDNGSAVYRALLAKEGPAAAPAAPAAAAPAANTGSPVPEAEQTQASAMPTAPATPVAAAEAPAAPTGCAGAAIGGVLGQAVGGEVAAGFGKMLGGLAGKSNGQGGC
jgi:hypothetical protein